MKKQSLKKHVYNIAKIVVKHGVSSRMTGPKTFSVSFHMEQDVLAVLLSFMVEHGYELDESISIIGKLRQEQMEFVRSAVARSGKAYSHESTGTGFIYAIIVGALLMCVPLILAEILPLWGFALISIFCLGMICLLWSPQNTGLNAIWKEAAPAQEKLERMLKAAQERPLAYAYRHKKGTFIALAVSIILCIVVPTVITAFDVCEGVRYHAIITAEGSPLEMIGSKGNKFVLYDVNKEKYFYDDFLPEEYKAESAEEIVGVLKIDTEKRKVGTYGDIGDAYRYYVTISLYDCTTGQLGASTTIKGSTPPKTLRVKSTTALFGVDGHGSKPSDEEMRKACLSLIEN